MTSSAPIRTRSLMDAFRAHPAIARPLHDFAEAVMRGPSPFTAAEREAIAVRVSIANGCDFCRDAHRAAALGLGLDEAALAGLAGETEPPSRLAPVLAFVDKLTRAPATITDADRSAVLDAGWDETALHHAALVTGFFALMNRWVEALGYPSDPHATAAAGRMLARDGYAALVRRLDEATAPRD
ncbi:MAG: carboxymuconolactone decarboxylase family protein [Pseudomonadota bacterium]